MPTYKLHYFDIRGRGEPLRMMFAFRRIPLEEVRFSLEQWPQIKATYPNGQVPLLEIDGKRYPQSCALYRYVARKLDLTGTNDLESLELDTVAELFRDYQSAQITYFGALIGYAPGDKNELRAKTYIPTAEKILPQIEEKLRNSKSGFFGSKVSFVDFLVAETLRTAHNYEPQVIEKYPRLMAHIQKVENIPELREYIRTRPERSF